VAKKAETKQIKTVADLVGEKVTVRVTDGNRVTEETTFIGVVLAVMEYGVLINYPRRGALISDVLPWTHIVQLSHRAKGIKVIDDGSPATEAPKRRGRKPQEAAEPQPQAEPEPEATTPEPEPASEPEPEAVEPTPPAAEPEPDPEPDPEPEDEGSAVGEEDEDEDEVYTGEEDDDNDEDFYGVDEDFGGDDDED
jgi:hypothetical protein